MNPILAGILLFFNAWVLLEVWQLRRGHALVLAQLKLLTEESKNMATQATISAQALADLQAADTNLKAAITQTLTYIQTKLGGIDTDDSAQVEAVVADIQQQTSAVLAAIAPPADTSPTSQPTPAS